MGRKAGLGIPAEEQEEIVEVEEAKEAEKVKVEVASPPVAAVVVPDDEFIVDGIRFRRIHRLEGNRWIDRCVRVG